MGEQSPTAESNRPGGGLGAPIDAPDPLEKYRWPIIGAFIVLLGIGGWIVTKRQGAVSAASGPHVSGPGALGSGASGANASRATFASGPLAAPITGPGASAISGSAASQAGAPSTATSGSRSATLLEALKEELFQLEVERKQGKLTAEEYEKAKAALDQTLDRALKRQT